MSTQKLPSVAGAVRTAVAGQAAGNHQGHGNARRRRGEVVPGQAGHLGQIAHRRLRPTYDCQFVFVVKLAAVLKASSAGTAGSDCGLSGSQVLQPLDGVGDQHAQRAERQQGEGVLQPGLLAIGPHAAQAIEQSLEAAEERAARAAGAPRRRGTCKCPSAW